MPRPVDPSERALREIARAAERAQRLRAQADAAEDERDRLIVKYDGVVSRTRVAERIGLTRGRVQQIVTANRREA